MKKLNQFLKFDSDSFLKGKLLRVTGVSPIMDGADSSKRIGTKIAVVILKDETVYETRENEQVSNIYEKFNIKVKKSVDVELGAYVTPVNPECKVYGEFRNQLSCTADDIRIIQTKSA